MKGPGGLRCGVVRTHRSCSRSGCPHSAVATLTYVYAESTAVVGPLATTAEPHTYDLCSEHAARLTAPRGWQLVRADGDLTAPAPSEDDLSALADAVREAARPSRPEDDRAPTDPTDDGRRGHLRALPSPP